MYTGLSLKREWVQSLAQNRPHMATLLAILLHSVGLVGMTWVDRHWFANLTPVNLIFMVSLLIWTHTGKTASFYLFLAIAFFAGMTAEIIGVRTGIFFGDYSYGVILGPKLFEVPILIGFNWFMVVFSARATFSLLRQNFSSWFGSVSSSRTYRLDPIFNAVGTAVFATIFDWVMEPVAVKLGFWYWNGDGGIPLLNYTCWFALSFLLALTADFLKIRARNSFAVNIFLIQLMFFIILRFTN
jgi:putative membrane protein